MKAIKTRYRSVTQTQGSRMIATDMVDGLRKTIPYDHALKESYRDQEQHANALQALCDRMKWCGRWFAGTAEKGTQVWVNTVREPYWDSTASKWRVNLNDLCIANIHYLTPGDIEAAETALNGGLVYSAVLARLRFLSEHSAKSGGKHYDTDAARREMFGADKHGHYS